VYAKGWTSFYRLKGRYMTMAVNIYFSEEHM
jgi:hypothetical protein